MNARTMGGIFDDVMDSLAHVERRRLLLAILDRNPRDEVPAAIDGNQSDSTVVNRLITMRHTHLPKLESYGFVEWNRDAQKVAKGPNFDEIKPLLEFLDDHRDELPPNWL